jgi:hypothetical protein
VKGWHRRFIRWARLDVWERLLDLVQKRGVALGMAFLDGTTIRAHQKAAGAKKGEPTARGEIVGSAWPLSRRLGHQGLRDRRRATAGNRRKLTHNPASAGSQTMARQGARHPPSPIGRPSFAPNLAQQCGYIM